MYWVSIRKHISSLPNVHGPISSVDDAEAFASNLIVPSTYEILDGDGKVISQVTISTPSAQVQRTK